MRMPSRRRCTPGHRTLALLLLLIAAPLLARADALSIHVIQRADAQALVPVIRPLLPEGGYVNAYQGKLVIRTTSANFDQVLAALGDMPEVPRTVSVHLRRRADGGRSGGGVSIDRNGVRAGAGSIQRQRQDDYRIDTLAGHAAGISQGTLVALTGTQYPALMTLKQGIRITPVMTGDGRVRLTVAQRFDEPAGDGVARTQGADTTLVVTPGQWRPLGAITVSERTGALGLSGGATHSERLDLPLEVKVEIGGR